ncbi:hypothetical protein [Pseudocitrobacter corydidari]
MVNLQFVTDACPAYKAEDPVGLISEAHQASALVYCRGRCACPAYKAEDPVGLISEAPSGICAVFLPGALRLPGLQG